MPEPIRITDLANPQFTELQRSMLEFEKTLSIRLDAGEILEEAKSGLSLDDFGPMDFLARLELLCDEWGSDSELNNLGKLNLRNKLLLVCQESIVDPGCVESTPRDPRGRDQETHHRCRAAAIRDHASVKSHGRGYAPSRPSLVGVL